MNAHFLEMNNVVVNTAHIVEVDFTSDGAAVMHMSSGNCRTYTGEDAAALKRFFTPDNSAPPPAPEPVATDPAATDPASGTAQNPDLARAHRLQTRIPAGGKA
jgi:hypothetical protein